jgi:site-specific recombinase XerD
LEASGDESSTAETMVPWARVALFSNHSVNACGRDLMDFVRRLQAQGVTARRSPPITSSSTFILLEAGKTSATVARRMSELRDVHDHYPVKSRRTASSPNR